MHLSLLRRAGVRSSLAAAVVLAGFGVPAAAWSSPATETETVTRTVPIAPGGTLEVHNFSGRVVITGSDRTDVSVTAVRRATRERLDRIKLDVRSEGGKVVIEANKQLDERRKNDNVVETDLTIDVPRQVNLDVDAFSSPVTVANVTGTHHHVKTFSGEQRLERVSGPVDAETFSGAIALASSGWTGDGRLQLRTFSGDIDVQLPSEVRGSVEFDTFSGDFESDVPLTLRSKEKRTVRADLPGSGTATASLQLKTFSGDVRLRK